MITRLIGFFVSLFEAAGICPACLAPWDGNGPCGRCGGPYFPSE